MSKKYYTLIWLSIPLAVIIGYPFAAVSPKILKILSITLSLYVLFFSIVIHEVSHGWAARWCGDPTADQQGRLTLNPITHVSVLGSIIVPLTLYLLHSPTILGWAKPVPFNPLNRSQKNRRNPAHFFLGISEGKKIVVCANDFEPALDHPATLIYRLLPGLPETALLEHMRRELAATGKKPWL